jgi:hypothetical protein
MQDSSAIFLSTARVETLSPELSFSYVFFPYEIPISRMFTPLLKTKTVLIFLLSPTISTDENDYHVENRVTFMLNVPPYFLSSMSPQKAVNRTIKYCFGA